MDFELFRESCKNINICNDQILRDLMEQKRLQHRSFTQEEVEEICLVIEQTNRTRLLGKFQRSLGRHKELA